MCYAYSGDVSKRDRRSQVRTELMDFDLDIVRNIDCEVDDDFFVLVVKETIARSCVSSLSAWKNVAVGIALVNDEAIAELNRTYRGKDVPTDVLSFSEYDGKEICPDVDGNIFLGDLVIAPGFVRAAAEGDMVPFRTELAFVVSHGILHLLGFEHSPKMFQIQDEITEALTSP
ncbi:MAG: rRNA maturation RNase YbeY [Candidatus Moranbacteria bacterium]|nr:rRNA maturation RNase YbeY [Candidatus Moranbacteria bacterium]NTW75437.1 rRNA maturation RNase YbeY [Candidatus Moranbacteria bacterium]